MPNNQDPEMRDAWRQRVDAARRDYERARDEAARALERIGRDATNREIDALRELHGRESAALTEYMRVLRIFHQLTVIGERRGEE